MRADLRVWAKKALEKTKDNPGQATRWLASTSTKKENTKTRNLLLILGANDVIRRFFGEQRASAMSMAAGRVMANINSPDVSKRQAARMARTLFWDTYTLYGMQPISSATRPMLLKSANQREVQARGDLIYAKFERAVAAKLKTNRVIVSRSITPKQMDELAARFKIGN